MYRRGGGLDKGEGRKGNIVVGVWVCLGGGGGLLTL